MEAREKARQQPTLSEQFAAVSTGLFGSLSLSSLSSQGKGQSANPGPASDVPPKEVKRQELPELPEVPDLGLFKAMSVFGETAKKNLGTFGESTKKNFGSLSESTKKNLDSFSETAKKNLDTLVTTVSTASANVTSSVASSTRSPSFRFPLAGGASSSGKGNTSVSSGNERGSPMGADSGADEESVITGASGIKTSSTPPIATNKFAARVIKKVSTNFIQPNMIPLYLFT